MWSIDVRLDLSRLNSVHDSAIVGLSMEIVSLPLGKQAPVDVDCIRIEQAADAVFNLTASALCVGADDGESVTIVDAPAFESAEKAEAAGLVWLPTSVSNDCSLVRERWRSR